MSEQVTKKPEFFCSRISSRFDWRRKKCMVTLWGYNEDGHPVTRRDEFDEYYYLDTEQASLLTRYDGQEFAMESTEYPTFDGKKAVKVISQSYKDKNLIKDHWGEYTYELDVPAEFKYILDNDIKWSPTRRIGFFDIEVFSEDEKQFPTPTNPFAPITCIQVASSHDGLIYVFSWHPDYTADVDGFEIKKQGNRVYFFCESETIAILSFFEWLKSSHIDVITGWYSGGFDLPYILRRCEVLNIDQNLMSPVGYAKLYRKGDFWRCYINGLDHVDMLEAVQDLGYNLTNYKLATAAKEILDDPEMYKLTEVTWRDWKTNYKGFLEYSVRDVEILVALEEALEIFSLYTTLQSLANLPGLNFVLMKSTVVDFYILTEYHGKTVFPSRITRKRKKYMGAMVLDPREPGLHLNVGVVDYASLYPTSVMAFNLSPETFIASENDVEDAGKTVDQFVNRLDERGIKVVDTGHNDDLFGKRYWFLAHSQRIGLLPRILKKLYMKRRELKAAMKKKGISKAHRNALDKHQQAIKLVLNSTYGAMGFPWFRLYKPEVADAITYYARQALQFAIDELDSADMSVIYGDTDSCFFKENGNSADEINEWVEHFNTRLTDEFIPLYNEAPDPDYNMLELEFEKDMERFYMGSAKKRYYGVLRDTGEKYIRGLNIIRKDAPTLLKDKLNYLAEHCVTERLTVEDLITLRKQIESASLEELGITKAFSKRFSEYTKNLPQHLKGARFANLHLEAGVTHMDNPLMFYITSKCEDDLKPKDRTKVICVNDDQLPELTKHPELFELDWDTFFFKQVLEQLDEFSHIESVKIAIAGYKEAISESVS
jgi:DNA polymerase elongation subunit (family B)